MVLAVFAGLPGVGKSTLAARVATELPAAVLAVDTVDFALHRYDVTEPRPGYAADPRRRVEPRYARRDHDGIPDWVRVLERQAEYEPYLGPRLVVDTHLAA